MAPPEPVIRRASPSDAQSIASLYAQLVSNPALAVLPERIAALAGDSQTALLVCERQGRIVGTALDREDAHRFFVRAGFAGSKKRGFVKYRREFNRAPPTHPGLPSKAIDA